MKRTNVVAVAPAVDFLQKTIVCSGQYLKRARKVNSPEYALMLQITRDLPSFALVMKPVITPARRSVQPSYSIISAYIRAMETDPADALEEFMEVRRMSKVTAAGYAMVRRWFLEKYPAFCDCPLGSFDQVAV